MADLGNGALGNLHRYLRSEDVDAVVISHMHADHFLDIIPMRYTLKYGPRTHDRKVALYLPPGGDAFLRRLVDGFTPEPGSDFLDVFAVRTYDPNGTLQFREATMRFAPTSHYVPTFAMRFEAASRSITYTADTAPDAAVVRLARGTDTFLCEATLHPGEGTREPRGHSTAFEAATMAERSASGRLVLTHYPAETNAAELSARARPAYGGPIEVADDNAVYDP